MPSVPRRRLLARLATVGVAGLAGCSGGASGGGPDCEPRAGLQLRPVSDEDIVAETDRPPADLQPLARALVETARESGTATYDSADWVPPDAYEDTFPTFRRRLREPFPISPPGDPVHRYVHLPDGYHRLVLSRGETAETTEQLLVGRTNPDVNDAARSAPSVAFDDLPRQDRLAVLAFLRTDAAGGGTPNFGRVWRLGYLREANVESSMLVPAPEYEYVAYDDWFLRVEKQDTAEGLRAMFELSLARVADGPDGFAAAVKRTDGADLDGADLSADQRDLLAAATDGTAWVCLADGSTADDSSVVWVQDDGTETTYSRATFDALLATIGTARYVRYDGAWYGVRLRREL